MKYYRISFSSLFIIMFFINGFSQINCKEYGRKINAALHGMDMINIEQTQAIIQKLDSAKCNNIADAYNLIGSIHYDNAELQKAKEYLFLGEKEYYKKKSNDTTYAYNQMYMALVLILERNFEAALYHLTKAKKIAIQSNNSLLNLRIDLNLGLVKLELNELDDAVIFYEKVLSNSSSDSFCLGFTYQNLARIKFRQLKYEEALKMVDKAKSIWNDLDYDKGAYLLSIIESNIRIKVGDLDNALVVIQQGRSINKEKNKLCNADSYLVESEIYRQLGNKENEIESIKKALLLGDDLSIPQIQKAIRELSKYPEDESIIDILTELASKYKTQNKSAAQLAINKDEVVNVELENNQTIIKKQLAFISFLILLFAVLSFLFFKIRKQQKQISKLNQDLIQSNLKIKNQLLTLKEKNENLQQFTHVASHDLKSPLRTISSFAGLLKLKVKGEDQKSYLKLIEQSAQDMTNMISDLLEYSTVDHQLNIESVDISDLIDSTLMRISAEINESDSDILVDIDSNAIMANCDKIKISIVLQNLISNAINYGYDHQKNIIRISTKAVGENIQISVSDNGIGIAKEYQEKVFEMFQRLKDKNVSGTGIGLATCKKIINMHKGDIGLISEEGRGSNFIISLPK